MILAPLQLTDYWLDSVQMHTNPDFNPLEHADLEIDAMEVDADVKLIESEGPPEAGTTWMVSLGIRQTIPAGKNIPYEFALQMHGVVAAHPSLTGETLERAVQVNGPSMLFGAAREILRAATGRGPFAPVIIPSTNFFQRLRKPQPQIEIAPPAAKKKARKPPQKRTPKS